MKRRNTVNRNLAVAYLRVSTEDQQLGPEAQRAAIERWAATAGVTVVAWHVDHGVSGGAELDKRPALQLALDALEQSAAGALVVAKRDRLARDVVLAALIERLVGKSGARVVSAAGEGGDDANDPSSMLMRRIVDAFAEYERALIRARTRAALAVKKKRGERAGNVPFGYKLMANAVSLERDEREQLVIAHALELRASGASVRGVVMQLKAAGVVGRSGRPLCKAAVENILRRTHGRSTTKAEEGKEDRVAA